MRRYRLVLLAVLAVAPFLAQPAQGQDKRPDLVIAVNQLPPGLEPPDALRKRHGPPDLFDLRHAASPRLPQSVARRRFPAGAVARRVLGAHRAEPGRVQTPQGREVLQQRRLHRRGRAVHVLGRAHARQGRRDERAGILRPPGEDRSARPLHRPVHHQGTGSDLRAAAGDVWRLDREQESLGGCRQGWRAQRRPQSPAQGGARPLPPQPGRHRALQIQGMEGRPADRACRQRRLLWRQAGRRPGDLPRDPGTRPASPRWSAARST